MSSHEHHTSSESAHMLEADSALLSSIKAHGGFKEYAPRTVGFKEAFQKNVRACVCCDGRINAVRDIQAPAVRLPGTTVFQADKPALAARFKKAGITELYSHEDCGAARAAFGKQGASSKEVAAFAIAETKKFCEEYGFVYKGHIDSEPLRDAHTEQVLYFDTTDGATRFEQSLLEGQLPQGFGLTASLSENPYRDLSALIGIAFGAHGAGAFLLGEGRKFTIVVIAEDAPTLERETAKLAAFINSPEAMVSVGGVQRPMKDLVEIDGFVAAR